MTYTTIPDTSIDGESILDENTTFLLRDNPIATAAGDSGAPRNLIASLEASIIPWIKLTEITISNDGTIDFTGNIDSTYELYKFVLLDVDPATDGSLLQARIGTGGTPTWQSGGSAYSILSTSRVVGSAVVEINGSSSAVSISGAVGNAATESLSGVVLVFNPANASESTKIQAETNYEDGSGNFSNSRSSGNYKAATAVTGIRFLMSSGNLNSGKITMYGLRK